MEDNNSDPTMGMGPDIDLMDSKVHIVQDVEEDLEEYTRLTRIGRFGDASKFFRETLHRHIGCFAVLAEHCNALVYQGDFRSASSVLRAAIGRQEASATGSERFQASELHFLRALFAYVDVFADTNGLIGRSDARSTVCQARWFRDTITTTEPRKLLDEERQTLLTCMRIFILFVEKDIAAIEDLRLPWSSRPSYPGETLKLSEDYLAWFEILLPEHPWDACIVLEGIEMLRPQSCYSQDYSVIMGLVERNFPGTTSTDISLFARMLLLGKLFETSLTKRWCKSDYDLVNVEMDQLVVDQFVVTYESEELAGMIERILEQHSGTDDVTETRPYKQLQLLIIDHGIIRDQKPKDARKAISRLLYRLSVIEKFAASPEAMDHQLALDVMYHQYIFLEKREWRKTMLNKIAHFVSRFGATQETSSLKLSIFNKSYLFSPFCHPQRTYLVSEIIKFSADIESHKESEDAAEAGDRSSSKKESIFENILHHMGDHERDETPQNERLDQYAPHQRNYIESSRHPGALQPASLQIPYSSYPGPSYDEPLTAARYPAPVRMPYNNHPPTDPVNHSTNTSQPGSHHPPPPQMDHSFPHRHSHRHSGYLEQEDGHRSLHAAWQSQPRHDDITNTATSNPQI